MSDEDIWIGNDEDGDQGSAFVYLRLFDADIGNNWGRPSRPEFRTRKPVCISTFTTGGLYLEIANSGQVPSDLVMVEYQVVYCTAPSHGPSDGFLLGHAGETASTDVEAYASIDFVPALGRIKKEFRFKSFDAGFPLANLYFRARVSTLWSPRVEMKDWDFGSDPAVTEGHLRIT